MLFHSAEPSSMFSVSTVYKCFLLVPSQCPIIFQFFTVPVANFAAESFMNLAKPFVGQLLEKFEFYRTRSEKWKPALLRKISQDQLPPKYGGKEGWKPVALA